MGNAVPEYVVQCKWSEESGGCGKTTKNCLSADFAEVQSDALEHGLEEVSFSTAVQDAFNELIHGCDAECSHTAVC